LLETIIHPDDREALLKHFRGITADRAPHVAEYRIISRSGEERWIEHICQAVLFGADHRWLGHRASNRDITDRKKAEAELKERIKILGGRLSQPSSNAGE